MGAFHKYLVAAEKNYVKAILSSYVGGEQASADSSGGDGESLFVEYSCC